MEQHPVFLCGHDKGKEQRVTFTNLKLVGIGIDVWVWRCEKSCGSVLICVEPGGTHEHNIWGHDRLVILACKVQRKIQNTREM